MLSSEIIIQKNGIYSWFLRAEKFSISRFWARQDKTMNMTKIDNPNWAEIRENRDKKTFFCRQSPKAEDSPSILPLHTPPMLLHIIVLVLGFLFDLATLLFDFGPLLLAIYMPLLLCSTKWPQPNQMSRKRHRLGSKTRDCTPAPSRQGFSNPYI
jgi:hypothetical protein